jgi:hypothetical protein
MEINDFIPNSERVKSVKQPEAVGDREAHRDWKKEKNKKQEGEKSKKVSPFAKAAEDKSADATGKLGNKIDTTI